jgi:hypothetical protein
MKTYTQLSEDIASRRQELHQRRLDQMQSHKERVAQYQASQAKQKQKASEKEQLKKEITQELRRKSY